MRKILDFTKDPDGRWYAVIPDWPGDRGDLEMICGADMLLELIAQGENPARVTFDTRVFRGAYLLNRTNIDPGEVGAHYYLSQYKGAGECMPVWLCAVTKHIFGCFPSIIYFAA
jgi:hypothetical protein